MRRHLALTIAGLLALVPALAACNLNTMLGQNPNDCSLYQANPKSNQSTPLMLVLLDLSDNSADTGQQVATALQPYLSNALASGAYIKVIASGGSTVGTKTFPCFTGTTPYLVDRNNTNRQDKDRASGATALQTQITQAVQEVPISQTGSVTALLGAANDDVTTLKAIPGVRISNVTLLVWSNLLGTGTTGDCMNVDNQAASVTFAEGVVKRCFAAAQLSTVDGATIRFLGINQGANLTPPQQELARYLREELCRRLSSDCS
jgi:hypothetical protein